MHVYEWNIPQLRPRLKNGCQFWPLWESIGQPLSKPAFVGIDRCRRFGITKAASTYHRR
jgi:hypothetical protein